MVFFDDGWTEVRYGRRRQRPRPPNQDWGFGKAWGKARARPGPFKGPRTQYPPPNRPAPPPGQNRYLGPQSRSYARVVNQGYRRPTFRPFASRGTTNEQVKQQAADPQFGQLVRKMHSVIKMVHHLQNVSPKPGKPEPKMITRMVDVLYQE